jgi:anti-sigma B factor antagonist
MTGFDISRDGRQLVVTPAGELVASMVAGLKGELQRAIDDGAGEMVFDLSGTTMVDSSGIGLMIAAYNSLSARQGTVRVKGASDDIFRLLQSMRLDRRLNVTRRG